MRAGTVLLFMVLIVMGFGFLLSSHLYIQRDLTTAQQQIDAVIQEKKSIEDQLNHANTELTNLRRLNEVLSQEKLSFETQVGQIQDEYASVIDQNARLQAQINAMNKLNPLIRHLTNFDPRSLTLALFVPLLPISLASGLLIYRNGKSHHRSPTENVGGPNHGLSMYVTNEEMKLIRQLRRNGSKPSK